MTINARDENGLIPGWFDFGDLYAEAVATAEPGDCLVEVGCFLGRSLAYLGVTAKQADKGLRIVGVELGLGSGKEDDGNDYHRETVKRGGGSLIGELHRNLIAYELEHIVSLIVAPSTVAASFFADDSLRFVFIDANHTQPEVEQDILAWLPKVRPGGRIAGHDYNGHWPGVVNAVTRVLPGHQPCSNSSWMYTKGQ